MADLITPKDVIKIIEATINFLDINLVEEDLSPSSEMERQETVDRLNKLIENLTSVKGFTTSTSDIKAAKKSKDETVVSAVAVKSPCAPVENPTSPTVDMLTSKLKVLTKWPIAELKEHAEHSGILRKYKKQLLSKWNRRYCVLCDGILLYFQSETDTKGKGYIILGGYKFIIPPNSNGFTFTLESNDKSTIYTFQADQKKEIQTWKECLLKVTDQGYTAQELQAVESAMKEVRGSNEDYYGDVPASPAEEAHYGDVADPEPVENFGDVAPPAGLPPSVLAELYYGDVAPVQPTDDDYYGDVAEPVIHPGEDYYGDVADPVIQPGEELYEELPDGTSGIGTVIPPHVPCKLPGVPEFSTENIYIGVYDCTGDDPQDLSFNRGDVMYILEKIDFNWWMGFLNGKVGLVPSNFLTEAFAS